MGRCKRWSALVAAGLGVALLAVDESRAQLADPPLGWDMWDPGWTQRDSWQPDRMDDALSLRMDRHQAFIREDVPAPYRDAQNPLSRTPANVERGRALYAEHCAALPRSDRHGRGRCRQRALPVARAAGAAAADAVCGRPVSLWAISEGGEPFGTRMPAFKDTLDEAQIWQIITYHAGRLSRRALIGQPDERPAQVAISSIPPQAIRPTPMIQPTQWPAGATFSSSTNTAIPMIQNRFMMPP